MIGRSVSRAPAPSARPPTAAPPSRGCAGHDGCAHDGAAANRRAGGRRMRFEKWTALGNDYLILEASDISFPLTAATVRRLCDRHTGPGADGVLELSPAAAPGFVARLRIFNPDGSEAELSGNGAREAIMYLRRAGWTDQDEFSIQTVAGEIRPTILDATTCRVDMGRARLRSEHFPGGGADGTGEVAGRRFQHVAIGNPQCAIRVGAIDELVAL